MSRSALFTINRERPTDLAADMAGTWTKRGDTITFDQVSTTFVSEVPWILETFFLSVADSFDGNFYDVVLERIFQ